ncbi:MAG: NAD-dependent epimerase [Omnitrophica WOR_2 bacterium GWA2_47_8]|nr:MAG: NAD-dependent epimerase [Omnitrophica WOR_2 bacterium GWA2_47_8]
MSIVLVTGSSGLVGSGSVSFFSKKGFQVIGIDNDMRRYFFGKSASTRWVSRNLEKQFKGYKQENFDIRDLAKLEKIFKKYKNNIKLIIHAAAQPSHDWAAQEPFTDFSINAGATLNLLEMTRCYCPKAVFIFTSTNKVYGDRPNTLPLVELPTRWEIKKTHPYYRGIDESMSIDASKHSLFGASKLAADIMVQEYGRYFGLKTAAFRAGCVTGPQHSGAVLHGFLAYLMKCTVTSKKYSIYGYKGKQVRDNIHSYDLVNAFYHFYRRPRAGEVYNIGGGRQNSCSVLEAIKLCESISGKKLRYGYIDSARCGDHIWYISDLTKFKRHYPSWEQRFDLPATLEEIYHEQSK